MVNIMQSSSQQNYWTIKTIDNLSGSVKLIFVECCEFSDVVNIARRRRKKNLDFLLLGSISVWSNSSILSCIGHLAAILSHLLVEFFKVRVYYGSLTLPLRVQYCCTVHCSHNIIIQMIELMTKNRNTKIYNFLCFKSHYGCSGTACGFPYDSFA